MSGILVCGCNGSGKSTLGRALARHLDCHFIDIDDLYFPKANPDYLDGTKPVEENTTLIIKGLDHMKQEKSCGAVIFREDENARRFYLILKSTQGHTTLCKGHVEKNETEHETAAREIREETSLTVDFLDGFREVITYSPYAGCTKDVVFFLARVTGGTLTCQPEEVADARFLPFDGALAALTHASDRTILQEAYRFLEKR